MPRRRVIFLVFFLIASVFAVLFVTSKGDTPRLAGIARDDLLLAGVVINAALAGLAAFNDIWELMLKLFGRQAEADGRDKSQEWWNRWQLIQNVKATWIQGVREQALHQSVWIELGVKLEPEQVNRPWHMAWQTDAEHHVLSEDTSIMSIFREQAANTLLILGEPGSGKTVTLLDLAQQLLDEAENTKDREAPIPVVFNLSSWALKRQPLGEWLLEDGQTRAGATRFAPHLRPTGL